MQILELSEEEMANIVGGQKSILNQKPLAPIKVKKERKKG